MEGECLGIPIISMFLKLFRFDFNLQEYIKGLYDKCF